MSFDFCFQKGLRIEGPSPAKLEPTKKPDGTMDVSYFPTEPGEYAVHVLCNNEDIPKSPFMADIKPVDGPAPAAAPAAPAGASFDASKVVISSHDIVMKSCNVTLDRLDQHISVS